MIINKSNYEFFALDYLEDNLPSDQMQAMRAFLRSHPLIANEVESLREMPTFVADDSITFDHKSLLLKKEEKAKVVWMTRKIWYRVGSVAAAVSILLIGYLAGYFSANQQQPNIVEDTIEVPTQVEDLERSPVYQSTNANEIASTTTLQPKAVEQKEEKIINTTAEPSALPALVEEDAVVMEINNTNAIEQLEAQKILDIEQPAEVISSPTGLLEEINRVAQATTVELLPSKPIELVSQREIKLYEPPSNAMAVQMQPKKKRLSNFKQYLGKLPFDGVTVDVLIPTYFSDTVDD